MFKRGIISTFKTVFFQALLFIIFISTAAGETKKVYLYPVIPVKAGSELCSKFTGKLKEKLAKSELFEIIELAELDFDPDNNRNIQFSLRKSVEIDCRNRNIRHSSPI